MKILNFLSFCNLWKYVNGLIMSITKITCEILHFIQQLRILSIV